MRQEIINLYDEFTHRGLERRVFMQRLAELAGGTAAAAAVLPLLEANYAAAAMIEEGDGRVTAERVSVPGQAGDIKGYLVRPAAASGRLPAVVVVHENRGLNPHIEDVARRAAVAGFVALAPDFLSRAGGTPADPDQARDMIGKLDQQGVVEDARSLIAWLGNDERTNGKVGIVGFCWGGGVVGRVAEEVPELDAGVVFYGRVPPLDGVSRIKAPLLLNYAGMDENVNGGVPGFREALDKAGVRYELHMYEGAQHAFHNDTSEARYNAAAAKQAWERTMAFFKANLA